MPTAARPVGTIAAERDPAYDRDTYRDRVLELIRAEQGYEIVTAAEDSEDSGGAEVVDLVAGRAQFIDRPSGPRDPR